MCKALSFILGGEVPGKGLRRGGCAHSQGKCLGPGCIWRKNMLSPWSNHALPAPGWKHYIYEAQMHTRVWPKEVRVLRWNADLVGPNPAGCKTRWGLMAGCQEPLIPQAGKWSGEEIKDESPLRAHLESSGTSSPSSSGAGETCALISRGEASSRWGHLFKVGSPKPGRRHLASRDARHVIAGAACGLIQGQHRAIKCAIGPGLK